MIGLTVRSLAYRIGRVDRSERYPTDCHEIQAQGFNITGIYKIKPEDIEPFYALCDLTSAGGGWTVIFGRIQPFYSFNLSIFIAIEMELVYKK